MGWLIWNDECADAWGGDICHLCGKKVESGQPYYMSDDDPRLPEHAACRWALADRIREIRVATDNRLRERCQEIAADGGWMHPKNLDEMRALCEEAKRRGVEI